MATLQRPLDEIAALSSSPAFGTPVHPILPTQQGRPLVQPAPKPVVHAVIAVKLEPPQIRPLAFRTFTKKHNLTLSASSLQALASFIGKHCGTGWREEGTGERVLEEVARLWKAESGGVIVEDGTRLKTILRTLESCMSGGRLGQAKSGSKLSRESSFAFGNDSAVDLSEDTSRRPSLDSHRNSSFGMSKLQVDEEEDHDEASKDPRAWIKVHSAYEQPRFTYDMDKKHFVQLSGRPSLFPSPAHKTALFRERYNIIHQRLLRNEAFQAPSFSANRTTLARTDSTTTAQQFYKITPVANLLGRGGTSHLLLGMLVIAPTGTLALNDLSGGISLNLQHAQPLQGKDSAYFCPGMIVLVDGVYEEDWAGAGSTGLGNTGGVGGTIGGRFLGFSIGGLPVEKRSVSLGLSTNATEVGGGFGWTDFLGLGSERAIGDRMRRLEQRFLGLDSEFASEQRRKMVVMSKVTLDHPSNLSALRKVLEQYAANIEQPLAFLIMGDFCSQAALANAGVGSVEYKEIFNELAAVLRDFPSLLKNSTWVFVPGDNDPWPAAFGAGASTAAPRDSVPDFFTSRVQRTFTEAGLSKEEVVKQVFWTSNPTKLSFFGPAHEVMVMRDDISGRLRRNAVRIGQATKETESQRAEVEVETGVDDIVMSGALPTTEDVDDTQPGTDTQSSDMSASSEDYTTQEAKKLILSLLPQSTLSPFPLTDAECDPFAMTFEGCHVMNPGRLVTGSGRRKKVQWIEYDLLSKRGAMMDSWV
ncbi:DNA-directed DNA polymerase epsilon, subunit B [Recurvomyces mirabilis]|nr:DNA-directed DNA polymerase epsilon, subunit B [Recurvomyces mirabilis]